jgi:hypothetical protein
MRVKPDLFPGHFTIDGTDLSLIKQRIERAEFSDLSFFGFFKASTAARLVKKTHNGQDRRRGDDHPFGPRSWPPKNSQRYYGSG